MDPLMPPTGFLFAPPKDFPKKEFRKKPPFSAVKAFREIAFKVSFLFYTVCGRNVL
jgi:hypothetical protein